MPFKKSRKSPGGNGVESKDDKALTISEVIARAKKGSIKDVLRVASLLASGDCSHEEQARLVSATLDALHVFSKLSTEDLRTSSEAVHECIAALGELEFDFFLNRPHLLERLKSRVPFIKLRVVDMLSSVWEIEKHLGEKNSEKTLKCCWSAIWLSSQAVEAGWGGLWGDMYTYDLAVKLWLDEWTLYGNWCAARILSACSASPHLESFNKFSSRGYKRGVLLEIALSHQQFSPDDVVCLALSRLRRAEVQYMADHLDVITFLLEQSLSRDSIYPSIHSAFERHKGASTLLKCVDKLFAIWNFDIDNPDTSTVYDFDINLASDCLQDLLLAISSSTTHASLNLALRRNLIIKLACCSTQSVYSRFSDHAQNTIKLFLVKIIGTTVGHRQLISALYHSVTQYQLARGHVQLDRYILFDVFPSLRNSTIRNQWENLFGFLYHQTSSFRIISQERRNEVHACGNTSCVVRKTKAELRRCAGCYATLYCSPECQLEDWRIYEHKKLCTKYGDAHRSSGISPKDMDYLIRYSHEVGRRSFCTTAFNLHGLERKLHFPKCFGLFKRYVGDQESGVFAIKDEAAEVNACSFSWLPGGASVQDSEEERKKWVLTVLRIQYGVGNTEKAIQIRTAISRAATESMECPCCRFHLEEPKRTKNCEVLSKTIDCAIHE